MNPDTAGHGRTRMDTDWRQETGRRWAAAFLDAGGGEGLPRPMRARAGDALRAFAAAATARAGAAPGDWDEDDVKAGLWRGALPLPLAESHRRRLPGLCAAFLRWAARERALAQGPRLAEWAERLAPAFRAEGGAAKRPLPPRTDGRRRPNEPCACGSGQKHKRCCGKEA